MAVFRPVAGTRRQNCRVAWPCRANRSLSATSGGRCVANQARLLPLSRAAKCERRQSVTSGYSGPFFFLDAFRASRSIRRRSGRLIDDAWRLGPKLNGIGNSFALLL
jgi:hypothetical protein